MTDTKLPNEAVESFLGILYQFHVALEKCFELKPEQVLWIEKDGDISISSSQQIEVKHYDDDLTDAHENLWKTLKNWLHKDFDPTKYSTLILLTTQSFGENSTLKDWNSKSVEDKRVTLDSIFKKYSGRTKKSTTTEPRMQLVLSKNNSAKLESILNSFVILDSQTKNPDYVIGLMEKHTKHIPEDDRVKYFQSLIGFVVNPDLADGFKGWEISCDDFRECIGKLTDTYRDRTVVFPSKYRDIEISNEKTEQLREFLFADKIRDINYEDVLTDAITDYQRTNVWILDDMKNHPDLKSEHIQYMDEVFDQYKPLYRNAKRNASSSRIVQESQNFYDQAMLSDIQNFKQYNDTPRYFRNGTLHHLANDQEKCLVWNLGIDKDE